MAGGLAGVDAKRYQQRLRTPGAIGMSDTLPDRLSTDPDSPFHDSAVLERNVGVRFNGLEKTNVEEYCVSEGWVRLAVGTTVDRRGKPMTVKLRGAVEPYFRSLSDAAADPTHG